MSETETIEKAETTEAADKGAQAETETTTETNTQQTEQSTEPDWRAQFGDDPKIQERMKRFASPADYHKSYTELEKRLSKSGTILPGKDSSDEERAAFNKAIGVPEKADGYKFADDLLKGVELGDEDKASLSKITEFLHGRGGFAASPEVVSAAHQLYGELLEDQRAQAIANADLMAKQTETELKSEWGRDYKNNIGFANAAVTALFGADALEDVLNTPMADGSVLGANKAFMKAMTEAGRRLVDDPLFIDAGESQGTPESIDERISELKKLRTSINADERDRYARASAPGGELHKLTARRQAMQEKQRRSA